MSSQNTEETGVARREDEESHELLGERDTDHPRLSDTQDMDEKIESPPNWPNKATKLQRRAIWKAIIDIIWIGCTSSFIILAFLVKRLDGKLVDESAYGRAILIATQYFVTIYPILFTIVVGSTMTTIVAWISERGGRMILLEQLRGSVSIFGTLKTQFMFRTLNVYTILLITLWALSPFGAQAVLRVLSTSPRPSTTQLLSHYLNMTAIGEAGVYEEKNPWVESVPNSYYLTVLTSPAPPSPMDPWGNVKIPMLEHLDQTTTVDGWTPVPNTNVSYSSMIGIRVTNISSIGNSSLQLTSSYWVLNCNQPVKTGAATEYVWNTTINSSPSLSITDCDSGGSQRVDSSGNVLSSFSIGSYMSMAPVLDPNATIAVDNGSAPMRASPRSQSNPREILFQAVADYGESIQVTNCTVQFPSVDSKVECSGTNCAVTHMRSSVGTELSPLELCEVALNFYQKFSEACGPVLSSFSSATEAYIYYNQSPIEMSVDGGAVPMYNISGPEFSERLARLMNTYWIALNEKDSIVTNSTALSDNPELYAGQRAETIVNITVTEERFVCNDAWLAILIVSSTVLLVHAIVGVVLKYLIVGPEVLGFVSSMTRDNPNIPQALGGTTLDGYERARLLKSLRVRLGDVQPDKDVGHVALAALDRDKQVDRLRKGRLYL